MLNVLSINTMKKFNSYPSMRKMRKNKDRYVR